MCVLMALRARGIVHVNDMQPVTDVTTKARSQFCNVGMQCEKNRAWF